MRPNRIEGNVRAPPCAVRMFPSLYCCPQGDGGLAGLYFWISCLSFFLLFAKDNLRFCGGSCGHRQISSQLTALTQRPRATVASFYGCGSRCSVCDCDPFYLLSLQITALSWGHGGAAGPGPCMQPPPPPPGF